MADTTEDIESAQLVEADTTLAAFLAGFGEDCEKGNLGGLRGERVVNIVADIKGFAGCAAVQNFYEAVGSGFGIGDLFDGDDGFEVAADVVAIERVV